MNSDANNPDWESNSALPNAESTVNSVDVEVNDYTENNLDTFDDQDSERIISSDELNSVLVYLKGESPKTEVKTEAVIEKVESDAPSTEVVTDGTTEVVNADNPVSEVSSATVTQKTETIANSDGLLTNESELPPEKINHHAQVQFKTEEERILLILPPESAASSSQYSWSEIWNQIKQRLNGGDRLRRPNCAVHLVAQDRLLDTRQLQELAETLKEYQLELASIATSRRQTAVTAVSSGYSVEQIQPNKSFKQNLKNPVQPLADALYLEMTIRSGVEIRHPGTVVILGDVNPGGIVVADGDILVWGRLRGVAHAGALGNRDCLIMALQMEPTQLRIADAVARAPENSPTQFFPEVAHIGTQGIRIVRAMDFSRNSIK
ncbi:septum formation inhibitor MinC [Richelia sinica FACHB-800]|uniref:Probable septum site-determining protein MinC n=1 Tax=Richelia sinica FACHB-800 TaxID=1357546 RepID=A0A975T559_9NOST|nr:septum site-determining protein MinC [Richelia sinica]MBD2664882.1 septum site-determining protein MinC [Richelia sinica FACHB-800]QXE22368.1 septum formation inhibitor MinC [Richelia sinica FACHB-800]